MKISVTKQCQTRHKIVIIQARLIFLIKTINMIPQTRRRIKTEEKAKVVIAAWGAALIQFLAALAILHQENLKNRMNCTRRIWRKGWIKSSWCKMASAARNWIIQRRHLASLLYLSFFNAPDYSRVGKKTKNISDTRLTYVQYHFEN